MTQKPTSHTGPSLRALVAASALALLGSVGHVASARTDDVPEKETIAVRVERGVDALAKASDAVARERAVHTLIEIGPAALDAVRAEIGKREGVARGALERVAVHLLAARISATIRTRLATGLFFDGQYADLVPEGDAAVDALMLLVDDEEMPDAVRRGAINALADTAKEKDLARVRDLEGDPLLAPALREELGTLMAILGDTQRVDRQIEELSTHLESEQPGVVVAANAQLAHVYYRIRKYGNATECYERILGVFSAIQEDERFRPSPQFFREKALHHYNAACSYSLAGEIGKARDNLRHAVEIDSMHLGNLEKDGDLRGVREAEGYGEFRKSLEELVRNRSL